MQPMALKVRTVQATVQHSLTHCESENRTLRKQERKGTDIFELWMLEKIPEDVTDSQENKLMADQIQNALKYK